jgi:hypothetical protein
MPRRSEQLPIRIAFGPVMPGWGSWEWIGEDTARELSRYFDVLTQDHLGEEASLSVVTNHPPAAELSFRSDGCPVIYCPVDHYGSVAQIDRDAWWLQRCSRIVVHSDKLRKYFEPYAAVEYLDHHVKFIATPPVAPCKDGPLLWVGVRSNLPPLVEWLESHSLPVELVVLTNGSATEHPEVDEVASRPGVRVEQWTPERHRELLPQCRGAIDVKGTDFRQRHKPPTKALDFIAAGLPVALNLDSSSADHLRRLGFEPASPEDPERWLSADYWEETQRFGTALRELLSLQRIGLRWCRLIEEVLSEQQIALA